MKPFDLKQALAGKPVCTRDGRPVKIAGCNRDAEINAQLIGWLKPVDKEEIQQASWAITGQFVMGGNPHPGDLFLVGTKQIGWIRLVLGSSGARPIAQPVYTTRMAAEWASEVAVKEYPEQVIQIEWED